MAEIKKPITWKKGRGKLGIFTPLLGTWSAETETERGRIVCTRTFRSILAGTYIQLTATWQLEQGPYEELAFYGANREGGIAFWSFTSDGKQSQGLLADVTDIHSQAIGFEALMPAGLARMAYWPDEVEGIRWAVESNTKKGWNRFTEHHYFRAE